ncbi:hypothetical protein V1525DRAFT_90208 [Lipomyces kononenkoae]|uniref:Uncharacterized protein n=1 Tax=Lipomyces kononenkoae TaxID=34357 RepID=A0ACC3TB43_LIPKO
MHVRDAMNMVFGYSLTSHLIWIGGQLSMYIINIFSMSNLLIFLLLKLIIPVLGIIFVSSGIHGKGCSDSMMNFTKRKKSCRLSLVRPGSRQICGQTCFYRDKRAAFTRPLFAFAISSVFNARARWSANTPLLEVTPRFRGMLVLLLSHLRDDNLCCIRRPPLTYIFV